MRGEPTTKGNPYRLTKKQHIIPNKSISRFVASDGKVLVTRTNINDSFRCKPDNNVFCVNRVWDQRSESGWMAGIENRYQKIASLCNSGLQVTLPNEENETISRMYLLIWARLQSITYPITDTELKGVKGPDRPFDKETIELLESRYVSALDENGNYNSRYMMGTIMQQQVDKNYFHNFIETVWKIVHANKSDYIFSDSYSGFKILPINPTRCFIAQDDLHNNHHLKNSDYVNNLGLKSSQYYCFKR